MLSVRADAYRFRRFLSTFASDYASERSTAAILGQVMFLVAVALAFLVVGTVIGRDLGGAPPAPARSPASGMLIVTWFVDAVRRGPLGIGWLCALSLLIGLGPRPGHRLPRRGRPRRDHHAAGITALTVLGMGALGFVLDKDL